MLVLMVVFVTVLAVLASERKVGENCGEGEEETDL